jgi:glycosyltransferase involved in cell wall biosynthesis
MGEPTVGIIIPCFNQSRFAEECVRSVEGQRYGGWRAVLIDDASTEPDAARLDRLASARLRVIHLPHNLGRALVRNEGVRLLGDVDYVLNVDCDDALTPTYVALLVEALRNDPALGLAYGTLRYFGLPHATGAESWPPFDMVPERRYVENVVPGGGTMIRAAALRQTAGWRGAFSEYGSEDYDLWLQVVDRGWRAQWVREAVYLYRQHEQSFLAVSDEWHQVMSALMILRFHRKEISAETFLAPQIMPALYREIRAGHLRAASKILMPLLRIAPFAALKLAWRYYRPRLTRR